MMFSNKKKIIFLTATRADYGKIKSVVNLIAKKNKVYIYITGMHMLSKYGSTYKQVINENKNLTEIILFKNQNNNYNPNVCAAKTIINFSIQLKKIKPNLVLVHGDRIESLAAAIACSNLNILVGHIEGGEVSGNIDEHLRHAISKLSHIHFVSNTNAKKNLIQLGENKRSIFVTGNPDIDILNSKNLPTIFQVKNKYSISFNNYCIAIFHPEISKNLADFKHKLNIFINVIKKISFSVVLIYPNNDIYSDYIISSYKKNFLNINKIKIIKSMRFEYFLTLLKDSSFIIGNSSSAIHEAPFYGVPSINIGERQKNRFFNESIKNVIFDEKKILKVIELLKNQKFSVNKNFGKGLSSKIISNIINRDLIWKMNFQKQFIQRDP